MVPLRHTKAGGRRKQLGSRQLCEAFSGISALTGVAGPDMSLLKATHSLTRHGCLCHEVLVACKQLSRVLFYCPFL